MTVCVCVCVCVWQHTNNAIFLWLKASINWYQYYWCSRNLFYPNIYPLTIAIQHYSIIESYQFEHLLDFKNNN